MGELDYNWQDDLAAVDRDRVEHESRHHEHEQRLDARDRELPILASWWCVRCKNDSPDVSCPVCAAICEARAA